MNKYIYIKETGQVAGPLPFTEKPNLNPQNYGIGDEDFYEETKNHWNKYVASLPRIDIVGEHSFLDGQILEIGKDIQIDRWYGNRFRAAITTSNYSLSAIPLKQVQKDHLPDVRKEIDKNDLEPEKDHIPDVGKKVQKEKDFEPGARNINEACLASHSSGSYIPIEQEKQTTNMENNIPRRINVQLWTPVEKMIQDAVWEVETMGADVKLTLAVILLLQAREAVADFVDGVKSASQEVKGNATQQGWISVKDRLPDSKSNWNYTGECVVYYEDLGQYGISYYHYDPPFQNPCWIDFARYGKQPTHWMPLPENPNSEQGVQESDTTMPNHGTEPMANNNSFTEEDLLQLIRYCAVNYNLRDYSTEFYDAETNDIISYEQLLTNFLNQQKGA